MKLEPVQDYVVVDAGAIGHDMTDSGILIEKEDAPNQAKVVSFGPEVKLKLKKDQKVLIRTYGWEEVQEQGRKYLVGKEENIIAFVS